MEANAAGFGTRPREEFNAVRANSGVAQAKAASEFGTIEVACSILGDDQKIVPAGVSFREGNQNSSNLQ
jgi:hypothetical protein